MNVRKAEKKDMERLMELLHQVLEVHHEGRPDLFRGNCTKYTEQELQEILEDPKTPVLVGTDDSDYVLGYAFCQFQYEPDDNILTDIKTLYLDDLCVDEKWRGQSVGRQIYEAVTAFARENGCYHVTLNVWSCNPGAMKFYERCGLTPYRIGMEKIL